MYVYVCMLYECMYRRMYVCMYVYICRREGYIYIYIERERERERDRERRERERERKIDRDKDIAYCLLPVAH